jgi:hypothetical protein
LYSLSVQRGRIEYEGETSVYTQISPLKIRGKDEYTLIFPGGKMSIYSVSVLSILFWFPQRTHYFWRVFRFLFMEHKQDYRAKIKYAKKILEESKDKKNEWTSLKIPQRIMSVHYSDTKQSRLESTRVNYWNNAK